jgi:hypothetical protein
MARRKFSRPVTFLQAGGVLQSAPSTQCTVRVADVANPGTGVPAALYADDGTTPLSNPVLSDPTFGVVSFLVEEGVYDLAFAKVGYVFQPLNNYTIGAPTAIVVVPALAALTAGVGQIDVPVNVPNGARIVGVFVTNVIAPGATQGLTGYQVGTVDVVDAWSGGRPGGLPLTQGFTSTQADFGTSTLPIEPSGLTVRLTALGGLFDGTGSVRIEAHYSLEAALGS